MPLSGRFVAHQVLVVAWRSRLQIHRSSPKQSLETGPQWPKDTSTGTMWHTSETARATAMQSVVQMQSASLLLKTCPNPGKPGNDSRTENVSIAAPNPGETVHQHRLAQTSADRWVSAQSCQPQSRVTDAFLSDPMHSQRTPHRALHAVQATAVLCFTQPWFESF